jgi:hypothetical protein
VNQKYTYFAPLQEIFGSRKSRKSVKMATKDLPGEEVSEPTKAVDEPADLKQLGNVEVACLMGQFTRDETSGVDVLIVGSVNQNALQKYIIDLEEQEGKELRYTHFSLEEFRYRLQIKDKFTSNVMLSKKQVLVDKPGLLARE